VALAREAERGDLSCAGGRFWQKPVLQPPITSLHSDALPCTSSHAVVAGLPP